MADVVKRNLAFTAILSVPIFFGAAAIGDHVIITAFGSGFAGAAPFLVVLAASRVVKCFGSPMTSAVGGLDLPRYLFVINIISALAVLIGAPVIAAIVGPIGVAVSILLSTVVRYIIAGIVLVPRIGFRSLLPRQFGEQVFAGLVMFSCITVADQVLITDWITVVLTVGIGGVVYVATLLAVSPETRIAVIESSANQFA